MKQYLYFIPVIVCIGLITLFSNCSKSINQTKNVASNSYFPNTVGSYWIYDVYDSSMALNHPTYPRNYEVKVSIKGIRKMVDSIEAVIWEYKYPWSTDTFYFRQIGDSVNIYQEYATIDKLPYPDITFIQPFKDGKGWNGKLFLIDTSTVSNSYNLFNGYLNFDTCFEIYRYNWEVQTLVLHDYYWFKPNIGFVKIYYNDWLAPYYKAVWNLKEYYLK